jgi:hypothetical protein
MKTLSGVPHSDRCFFLHTLSCDPSPITLSCDPSPITLSCDPSLYSDSFITQLQTFNIKPWIWICVSRTDRQTTQTHGQSRVSDLTAQCFLFPLFHPTGRENHTLFWLKPEPRESADLLNSHQINKPCPNSTSQLFLTSHVCTHVCVCVCVCVWERETDRQTETER